LPRAVDGGIVETMSEDHGRTVARRTRRGARPAHVVGRAVWRVLGVAATATAASLILLHAWIFWDQLATGRLVDPALALKWIGAGTLCAALLALRRAGVALLWGRKAFVVWVLVAFLHVGAGSAANLGDAAGSQPDASAVFVLPALLSPLAALCLGVLLVWRVRRSAAPLRKTGYRCIEPIFAASSAACRRQIPPRAPPLSFAFL
jgi:hypothetical protein